jgi:macrolide resistance protein
VNVRQRRAPLYGLIAASGFSLFGNAVAGVALPWFVLGLTGSAAWTGVAAAAATAPFVLGAFFGGPIVDRFGSRRVALAADLLGAASVASIPLLYLAGHLGLGALLTLVVIGALLDGPGMIAQDARLPELARLARLPIERVTSIDELLENGAIIFGPPVAGLTIAAVGIEQTLFVTAVCSLLAATINAFALPRDLRRVGRPKPVDEIWGGARFLLGNPLLRTILVIAMVVMAMFAALNAVVLPALFRSAGATALDLGLFLATSGTGAVVAAVIFAGWGHRADGRMVPIAGLAGMGLALGVIAVFDSSPTTYLAAAVLGLSTGALGPLVNALFLRRAPAAIRGSVLGASTAAALAATPVALLATGIGVEALGAGPLAGLLAAMMGLLTLYAMQTRHLEGLTAAFPDHEARTKNVCPSGTACQKGSGMHPHRPRSS